MVSMKAEVYGALHVRDVHVAVVVVVCSTP